MKRRAVINRLTVFSSAVLLFSTGVIDACTLKKTKRTNLNDEDLALLDDIGETIIPATSVCGGAKAAKIGKYMLMMVNECYPEDLKDIFIEGLDKFEDACDELFKKKFTNLNSSQKKVFLIGLQMEANRLKKLNNYAGGKVAPHYFELLKELSISGYFTSEIGATQARRYEPVPGKFKGCIPYKKGDRAWATS